MLPKKKMIWAGEDVAPQRECCFICRKPWFDTAALSKQCMVVCMPAYLIAQGYHWLHSKSEVNLRHLRPCH